MKEQNNDSPKLVRITTTPISIRLLITGQPSFMKDSGFHVSLISAEGSDWDYIPDLTDYEVYKINMVREISIFKDIKALVSLIWVLRRIKPQIVHTHNLKGGLLGMVAAWLCRVPVRIQTVAGWRLQEEKGVQRKILEWVEKITYACATKVYPNSARIAEIIISGRFCSRNKVKVLGNGSSNGVDTEYFQLTPSLITSAQQLQKELNFTDKDFVFVFVGRLVKDKGIEELVDTFIELEKSYSNIKLLLLGSFEPELDPLPERTMRAISSEGSIVHVGFQHDIRPYLALSHALAFPTYREGFPNVPMQAACFHLPCIVTDINGCNEIIEDGINGLIIPVKDKKALYLAMKRLITDESLYSSLKANARRMIVERFDQKFLWSVLLDEYQHELRKCGLYHEFFKEYSI